MKTTQENKSAASDLAGSMLCIHLATCMCLGVFAIFIIAEIRNKISIAKRFIYIAFVWAKPQLIWFITVDILSRIYLNEYSSGLNAT